MIAWKVIDYCCVCLQQDTPIIRSLNFQLEGVRLKSVGVTVDGMGEVYHIDVGPFCHLQIDFKLNTYMHDWYTLLEKGRSVFCSLL